MSLVSFARSGSLVLAPVLATSLVGVLLAAPVEAAREPAPKLSGLKARVAQGGRVDLAASSLTAVELAALRPDYEKLRPRVRTNDR